VIHPVETLDEALALTLRGASLRNGHLFLPAERPEQATGDVSH